MAVLKYWDGTQWVPILTSSGLDLPTTDARYVKKAGDIMTGPLVLDAGVQDPDSPLTIVSDDYPSVKFFKRSAPANLRQWRQYVAGHTGPTQPNHHAMSWMPENDDGTDPPNDPAFRLTRDGRFMLPMNGAVEFRSSIGDIRTIGMGQTSEAGTYGIRVLLDRDANTLGSIGVASPYLPEHAAPRSYVDAPQTTGVLSPASGWSDYGSGAAGMLVSRSGGMVTVEATLTRSTTQTITGGSPTQIASVPAGFWPTHDVNFDGGVTLSTGITSARFRITAAGLVQLIAYGTGSLTVAASGVNYINAHYRGE